MFDFFEVDLSSSIFSESQEFNSYIYGSLSVTPWAVKAMGGFYLDKWKMGHTFPVLGHATVTKAIMFKCVKGDVDTMDFYGALTSITASEFYSGDVVFE